MILAGFVCIFGPYAFLDPMGSRISIIPVLDPRSLLYRLLVTDAGQNVFLPRETNGWGSLVRTKSKNGLTHYKQYFSIFEKYRIRVGVMSHAFTDKKDVDTNM